MLVGCIGKGVPPSTRRGTLNDLWRLYLKCEGTDVSISDLHLKDHHLSLSRKIDHIFHRNSAGLVTPVRGGERSNRPHRCSDKDLQCECEKDHHGCTRSEVFISKTDGSMAIYTLKTTFALALEVMQCCRDVH